uniref:Uncharacterized protein n=1 Tax=Arundo donax TaxID=35708 RepID=A0A0A8XW37_ARUDO
MVLNLFLPMVLHCQIVAKYSYHATSNNKQKCMNIANFWSMLSAVAPPLFY